jgi:hypothetical protein
MELAVLDENGAKTGAQLMAVMVQDSPQQSRLFFVEDGSRIVFGRLRLTGRDQEARARSFAGAMMGEVREIYAREAKEAAAAGLAAPSVMSFFPRVKSLVEARIELE